MVYEHDTNLCFSQSDTVDKLSGLKGTGLYEYQYDTALMTSRSHKWGLGPRL